MNSTNIFDYRPLAESEFAAIVGQLRKDKGWTQETLAEIACISVRTVQRVEEGKPSSFDTRRAIANAFEYEDLDIFNKPWPLPNIERLKGEVERIERETVAVEVQPLTKGRQLRELAEQADSFCLMPVDEPSEHIEVAVAELQEFFCEYGDCHDLYSPTQKLDINNLFQERIDALDIQGVGIVGELRHVQLNSAGAKADLKELTLSIAYVFTGPKENLPTVVRVPRRTNFGF